jgi:hypothetical protein
LYGRGVGEFRAVSLDLRVPPRITVSGCDESRRQVGKTVVCADAKPGLVRVGLFGPTPDSLIDGELMRVTLALPPSMGRGRYPISAIVRLARADGSEFEIGPIAATLHVRSMRRRIGR